MTKAGHDPENAVEFWTRMAAKSLLLRIINL